MTEHRSLEELAKEAEALWNEYGPRQESGELKNKDRREIPQQDMPSQDPVVRRKN